ncbi:hypothetical protein BDV19DRAFT_353563 [Aspergillus venezuelensis]
MKPSLIATIPYPIAGPKRYSTASQVAMMDFARTVLGIPAPKVLAYSADQNNPIASEYVIMENPRGTMLADIWQDLSLEEKVEIMKDLISIEKKTFFVSFTRYGNLYFSSEDIPGAVPAEVTGDVSAEVKDSIRRRFAIGPVVDQDFWKGERAEMDIDRGPWKRPQGVVASVAHREISWLSQHAVPKHYDPSALPSPKPNPPSDHISLLQRYLEVVPYLLPNNPDVTASHLIRTDLYPGNNFVKDNRISSIMNRQQT